MKKKQLLFILFILFLLYGTYIRIYNLGSDSFWIDESISALAAKQIHKHGYPLMESGKVYDRAMTFHYLMSGFLLFGYNDLNARIVSVIFGILTCVLIYFIGKEYNHNAAWIGFIFSLFLEIFIAYSRQARMYQMTMFLFFLCFYLLYKKKQVYSLIVFFISLETHIISLLLLPFFVYYLFKMKIDKRLKTIVIFISLFVFSYYGLKLFSVSNISQVIFYLFYLRYYAPFFLLSIIGFILSYKKKLTMFMGIMIIFILVSASMNKFFAYRYVYLAFLPLVILSSVALSKIKFKWIIVSGYIILVSNLIIPFGYSSVLFPASISYQDVTMPAADFKGFYDSLDYDGKLIVSFTPAAAWYYRKPDYWINFSFTGLENEWIMVDGKEFYTGAEIVENLEDSLVVIDDFSMERIDKSTIKFIKENCSLFLEKEGVGGYRC